MHYHKLNINIFYILLLCSIPTSLFSMQLSALPNNFCAKMYWCINNIDESLPHDHRLHKEIKQELLSDYFALTKKEIAWGEKYLKLVNIADYIPLNSSNKRTIRYLRNKHKKISLPHTRKKILLIKPTFDNHLFYQELLALPYNIRRKIARKYCHEILIKTNLQIPYDRPSLYSIMTGATLGVLPACYIYTHPDPQEPPLIPNERYILGISAIIISASLGVICEAMYKIFFSDTHIINKYRFDGYDLVTLVPEDYD